MNQRIHVRPRDDGQGWAVDVYDGRRAWTKTHLGEGPLSKVEAHRLARQLRDPKFYTARTKRAGNGGASSDGSFFSDGEAREADRLRAELAVTQRKARFHVLDKDDKRVGTLYAATEAEAVKQALLEGLDAWSAYDSMSRHAGGW